MEIRPIHPYKPIMIGVISVALSANFVKLATAEAGVIAFYRMLFLVLLTPPIFFLYYKKEVLLLRRKDWLNSTIAGTFFSFSFHFLICIFELHVCSEFNRPRNTTTDICF